MQRHLYVGISESLITRYHRAIEAGTRLCCDCAPIGARQGTQGAIDLNADRKIEAALEWCAESESGYAAKGNREGTLQLAQIGQLLLLATATWAATYARYATGPLQEAMRQSMAITDNRMAVLQGSAVAIPMVIGAIPVGILADRISRKAILLVATTLALIALMLGAMASVYNGLLLSRCLLGLSIGGMLVPAYAMGADLVAPSHRGRATMVLVFGEIGGSPAAFALGGALLVYISASPLPGIRALGFQNWAWTLLWMSAPLLIVLALLSLIRDPFRREVSTQRPTLRSILPELWRYRRLAIPLQLGRATLFIADGAVLAWGAPFFTRQFHMTADRIGYTMGIALLVAGIAGPLLGGPLVDFCQRHGGSRRAIVYLTALAALSLPFACFASASSALSAAVMLTLFLTLGFTLSAAALALTLIVIPGHLRALNVGVSLIVGSVFFIGLAPLAVSGLSGLLGGESSLPQSLAVVCGSASLLNVVVLACSARYFPRE
jgi:MFS family permease